MQKLHLLAAIKKPYEVELIQFLEFYRQDFDEDLLRGQLKTFSNRFPTTENETFADIISFFKRSTL